VDERARQEASILHVDLDAFFAAVEQRDKPSLRGKPVIVGGVGLRGVVATASYEARAFGVHSAMSMAQARARCPHAAFLWPRFAAYQEASTHVMAALSELSPLVEPVSLDEAFVDLRAGRHDLSEPGVREIARRLKATITGRTGLVASVGAAASKLVAKIASDLGKPDGLVLVTPGTEQDLLRPMTVRTLWGVGPATAERLAHLGVRTIGDMERLTEDELVASLGSAHGRLLFQLARARDDRPVNPEREWKSVSVEDTFDTDIADARMLVAIADRMSTNVARRLAQSRLSGRTVTVKARLPDFTTVSRSATLPAPTDNPKVVSRVARRLLDDVLAGTEARAGLRLLGVGVSGLADWVQDDLFARAEELAGAADDDQAAGPQGATADEPRRWRPGEDVVHVRWGTGWVWGAGLGRVTVRFESRQSEPGPVRTLPSDDPDLHVLSGHSQTSRAD